MSPSTAFAVVANATMPGYTAWKYAAYALWPEQFDDAYSEGLATLAIAQVPVALLGGVFAGVSDIDGPGWRRALIYVIVVAIVGVVGGFGRLLWDSNMAAILGWTIAMQLLIVGFAGPQPELARARIHAVTEDGANLLVLAAFGGVFGAFALLALFSLLERPNPLELTDMAWIGAAYFALRAWSAVYAFTPWFEQRRQGFFDREWIRSIVTPAKKESPD